MIDDARKSFEEWASNTEGNEWFYPKYSNQHGYIDGVTNVAFLAYSAAHNKQSELLKIAEEALIFYAKRDSWMELTEDSSNRRLLVAMKGRGNQDGFDVASEALSKIKAMRGE